jgi:hypothetical protein
MSFSVYSPVTVASGYVFVDSTVVDNSSGCSHVNYSTSVAITSPTGRVARSSSSGLHGSVSLAIAGDYGNYTEVTTGQYQCGCFNWQFASFGGGETIPVCPVPTNFTQYGPAIVYTDTGGGPGLFFTYSWQSNTGNLADLLSCTVGERVDFPSGSNPYILPLPFPASAFGNPVIQDGDATGGIGWDRNAMNSIAFRKPYFNNVVGATQTFRYRCPCANGGNYVTVYGPLPMTFSVLANPNGTYKYTLTKPQNGVATMTPLP